MPSPSAPAPTGIQYKNSTTAVDFIQTEEGKAVNNSGSYDYNYYLGDNLGNTRVTFGTKTGTAVSYQRDDYYPFGYEINRSTTSPKNEYLYNKKELQEELGQYDYGARYYDPVIARWNSIDPFAEKSRRWSPYNYGENNPIRNIDVAGDSIKMTSNSQFNSFYGTQVDRVDFSVTGKVENDSSTPFTGSQMQDITQRAVSAIDNYYSITNNTNSDGLVISTAPAQLTVASSSNPVVPGDDVFKLVDPGKVPQGANDGSFAPANVVGMSKPGGNVSYISTSTISGIPATTGEFANTGKTESGGPTLERTISHELGHLAGLDDVRGSGTQKNLMRQTGSPAAGTNLTPGQLKEMLNNYREGKLNTGQQSFN